VLLSAPTGSGKTLAAFLWALDRLSADPAGGGEPAVAEGPRAASSPRRTRLVYVSPLKALSYDIERNLRAPLRGIGADLRVGIRTGDTPQRERAAMARKPPDILVTTPESLYLILTSRAREMLSDVEVVIVDEIHAVAATKRGAHLALTLERLEEQQRAPRACDARPRGIQRIGLSATQNPLEELGRYLVGPKRRVRIIDTGLRKPLDLQIHVPVESMVEPDSSIDRDPLAPVPGGEATRSSIWPAIYPELLRLVKAHRSTIVFVNNRRAAERLALRLNELAAAEEERSHAAARARELKPGEHSGRKQDEQASSSSSSSGWSGVAVDRHGAVARHEIARAHHGSLAREERTIVEELLKAGELPCLVATSSLELGIDMGAVDLVLQVESPKSVARGLQRIGRSGHGVGDTSKGRIFPKFRADLLECAVVCRLMREGRIEPTVVPRNALDVLAQQIVAIAAAADEDFAVEDLYALLTRTHSYAELPMQLLENVLDMLDGRYPSSEFGDLRARIVWDRVAGTIRARKGSRQLAVSNAGTIPDRGLYAVTLPDGRRVGELDEEMVYEARVGQTFLLGASSWRIEEIGRDRVIVTPAPGVPGAVPFWKGDSMGRPKELGKAIGAFSRWAVDQDAQTLQSEYDLDERAAKNLLEFLREQQAATNVLPSDRTIVIERFRDEIGDWRLCVLSPYGGRIHAAWGLALSARIRERFGLEADAISSDDGIVVHLPDLDVEELQALPSGAELVMIDPEEVREAIVSELGASALFGARFRENASRALLIPRAYPGRRTPLWQQRLKAQNLLEVAKRYADFPIVLETYRECLQDVLDVPGLVELLRGLHSRELALVEVETQSASPFASSLLFDYVARYMYEGDTPNAERRAAALSLDRDLLRELLGQEELRELIDPDALEQVQEDLQHRSERTRATSVDGLHDMLRRLGELSAGQIEERVLDGLGAGGMLEELLRERRAIAVRIAGEERFIAADEAGLYRDALGTVPPGGLPAAFVEHVPGGLRVIVARYARTHGPFTTAEASDRYRVDVSSPLRELERAGEIVRGELRPGGTEREWCDVEVLRRLRRASLAALRKEIEPAEQRALAMFLPSWQGVDRHPSAGAGVERLREVLVALQGLALPVEVWERDVLPRRTGAYSQTWLDSLCASGELVWVGAGSLGRHSGRVALYFREDAPAIGPPPIGRAARLEDPAHTLLRERLEGAPCFFTDLLAELDLSAEALQEALWDLVWAGEVTNDAWAPLRAPRLTLARAQRSSGRGGATRPRAARRFGPSLRGTRASAGAQVQGRWSPTAPLFAKAPADSISRSRSAASAVAGSASTVSASGSAAAVGASSPERRRVLAELLLERYGIVTREQVLAEGLPGGFSMLYSAFGELETLGVCRRGYFVEGLGGAQFALPGAVERLRAPRSDTPAGGGSGWELRRGWLGAPTDALPRESPRAGEATLVIAAADPAQPYGAVLPWPRCTQDTRRPARVAGAYVAMVNSEPVLYLERGGRGLLTFCGSAPTTVAAPVSQARTMRIALGALAEATRAGRVGKLALERVNGEPAVGSNLEGVLVELGFHPGPRRLTLSA
jgi:ATP-dependent helicase Lhr and Lhr-like helicase